MTALLLRYAPYLAAIAACIGLGAFATHKLDSASYERLQAQYSTYQAQVSQDAAKAQEAARKALQTQLDERAITEAHNAQVIEELKAQADHATADRDFARRLLAAARQTRSPPPSSAVSAPTRQPGTDAAPEGGTDQSLASDLGDAAGECRDAISQLLALQAQLKPQL